MRSKEKNSSYFYVAFTPLCQVAVLPCWCSSWKVGRRMEWNGPSQMLSALMKDLKIKQHKLLLRPASWTTDIERERKRAEKWKLLKSWYTKRWTTRVDELHNLLIKMFIKNRREREREGKSWHQTDFQQIIMPAEIDRFDSLVGRN